jgi:CheY-like chemotaxis protein
MPALLVVDVDPSVLNLFRRTFETPGDVTVLTATSAGEALEIVRASRPTSR